MGEVPLSPSGRGAARGDARSTRVKDVGCGVWRVRWGGGGLQGVG
jgi:hypothetical protein